MKTESRIAAPSTPQPKRLDLARIATLIEQAIDWGGKVHVSFGRHGMAGGLRANMRVYGEPLFAHAYFTQEFRVQCHDEWQEEVFAHSIIRSYREWKERQGED